MYYNNFIAFFVHITVLTHIYCTQRRSEEATYVLLQGTSLPFHIRRPTYMS